MPHNTEAPSGSPVFSIAAAGALRGYAFRSLDAGAERHGGIWSRWGAGVCVFRGEGFVRVRPVILALALRRTKQNYHDGEHGLRG